MPRPEATAPTTQLIAPIPGDDPVAHLVATMPAASPTTHLVQPIHDADAAALEAELAAALAAGDLALDPDDYQALDLDLANLTADDFTLEAALSARYHAPAKSRLLHPHLVRYENAQVLATDLGAHYNLTVPGAHLHAILNGTFIFGDFIEAWVKANNWLIPDLWLATLSYNIDNVDSLANLLHGDYVQRIHLLVSDFFYASERHKEGLIAYAYHELDQYGGDRFQLSVTMSHAKVTLLSPLDEATGQPLGHYVLHGSANLRSSSSIEQLCIEHDPTLYAFHHDWLSALEGQYSTIHPHQPGPAGPKRKQWQRIIQASSARSTASASATPSTPPAKTAPPPPAAVRQKSAAAPSAPSEPPAAHQAQPVTLATV